MSARRPLSWAQRRLPPMAINWPLFEKHLRVLAARDPNPPAVVQESEGHEDQEFSQLEEANRNIAEAEQRTADQKA